MNPRLFRIIQASLEGIEMIKAITLYHPASKDLIRRSAFRSKYVNNIKMSCGTTVVKGCDLYEANDFFPSYAHLNSVLFETSVILTIWEHADRVIGDDHVAVLHSDITINGASGDIWRRLDNLLTTNPSRAVGITVPSIYRTDKEDMTDDIVFRMRNDPMKLHAFDNNIFVWDFIKKYDPDVYQWAMETDPVMIYSHQFACSRMVFDALGASVLGFMSRLRLRDVGFWTPHVFERLIALYLARHEQPILVPAFVHFASSGAFGPGKQNLYGPRGLKYYRITQRQSS